MEDLIIGDDGWLGEILVAILNRFGDLNSAGLILDSALKPVVFERYTYSPAFLATEVPSALVSGFAVYDDRSPKWAKGHGIIVERTHKGLPCQDGWVKGRGMKEV